MKSPFLILRLLLVLLISQSLMQENAHAKVIAPIGKHLKDALKLNKKRAPLYGELTNNKSIALSYELMAMESLAFIGLGYLDQKAQVYIKHGVGVFEDDLIDMKETPEFLPTFEDNNAPLERITINVRALSPQDEKTITANFTAKTFVYVEAVAATDTKKVGKDKPGGTDEKK